MKLKNSHILLIVMSIFLLISIGSVCAEDNSTADIDIVSNDGSDIALSDGNSGSQNTTQEKITTSVESQDTKIKDGEAVNIPVTVKDKDSKNINITSSDITVQEGNKTVKSTYNNSQVTITDKMAVGNHSLVINFNGNNNYSASKTNVLLSIIGNYTIQVPSSVDVNSTKNVVIPINITNGVDKITDAKDLSASISYKDGNDTKSVDVSNLKIEDGNLKFTYELADTITTSNLTLTYNDNGTKTSKSLTLNRIFNAKIEAVNLKNEYQNGNFTFKVTDVDSGKLLSGASVTLTTAGNIRAGHTATTNDEGIASYKTANLYEFDGNTVGNVSLNMKRLEVGNHIVDITTGGNVKSTKLTVNLTITKASIKIKINKFQEDPGTNKNVTITVTNAKNKEPVPGIVLKLNMPQTIQKILYVQTNSEGKGQLSVKNLTSGTYNITASNNDTKNINKASTKGSFIINPKKVIISTKSVTIKYNTGKTATIKVTYENGTVVPNAYVLVQLYTGSKSANYLFMTNSKGLIEFSAPLSVGKHKMVVNTADNRYKGSQVTKYITVKKSTGKFSAPKVTTYYKQGKYFTVKLVNTKKSNKPIYGANVTIKVYISKTQYYNYNGLTGADGKLQLRIDLNPGTYKVEVCRGETKNYTAKKITSKIVVKKTTAKITPTKLTAKKGESKKFKVKVINKKNKKAVIGVKVKVKVYTGKTYKTYKIKTNSKGIAKLNTKSLKVGSHKVVITSADKYCSASKAKSTIKITK